MLKSHRLLLIAGIAVIFAASAISFAFARYVFSRDSSARAQVGPSSTPEIREQPPHPKIAAMMTAIAIDKSKPRFIGELNGINFVPEGTPSLPESRCPNSELKDLEGSEASSAVSSSGLNFMVRYLPGGYRETRETAVTCGGTVRAAARVYDVEKLGHPISVSREIFASSVPAIAPLDRLEPRTIGGRPAVVVSPISSGQVTFIFMHDDQGTTWTLSSDLDPPELIKVAEGVE